MAGTLDPSLAECLASLGYREPVLLRADRGAQAVCYQLAAGASRNPLLAVKVFDRSRNEGRRAEAEYRALQKLHVALQRTPLVACPRPIARLPADVAAGYVMSAVGGAPLWSELTAIASPARTRMAEALTAALLAYGRASEAPYGDFQPDNVLVGAGQGLVLIDPSCPSDGHRAIELQLDRELGIRARPHRFLAMDIGYWLFAVTARGFRRALTAPRSVPAMRAFASRLVRAACSLTGDAQMETACLEAGRAHARCLAREAGGARRRLVGYLTLGTLRS